jgi:hypothetical protein
MASSPIDDLQRGGGGLYLDEKIDHRLSLTSKSVCCCFHSHKVLPDRIGLNWAKLHRKKLHYLVELVTQRLILETRFYLRDFPEN